ncbi:T20D4.11-like domain-containing protein [Caenorhabditis elegans]|uniref:DUF19 domain-containing protein n=1 Tax=Caenorhabditis elegans TaxID=6239 RepID=Q9N5A7_CAEEL|nr:DUF19 domain-containing protein [Caenorhabditis elegans]NP_505283.3 DUF19 domain-containing protein [Caenorhabditis elegans]CCD62324.3 DUF19 domain-containing protein [Caenorhabditis elegans]CCD68876.3 DUF19 domain-containing protein [Caenorhabditis elegans]|eukprot:NP_001346706.1 Uncharacterized protein CELE_W09B7.3 [Caenorhabditis elegans]
MFFLLILLVRSTVGDDEKTCVKFEGTKAFQCLHTLHDISKNAGSIDFYKKEDSDKMNMMCEGFTVCAEYLKCKAEIKVVYYIDKIVSFCAATGFLSTDFKECNHKLYVQNSTCVQEWEPLPDPVEDPVEMAAIQKEACKNILGKESCVEKEIIENCNVELAVNFRKHFLALHRIIGACENL